MLLKLEAQGNRIHWYKYAEDNNLSATNKLRQIAF